MKEWFKARNVWGAAISALSDDEAGRLAKAIWSYTMNGEIVALEGAGKGIFALILMTLAQDEEHDADVSAKRSKAAQTMHLLANASNCNQMQANDSNCNQMQAIDDIKNKNKSKNKEQESESESEEYIPDTEARKIQLDHDTILNAAENAGFKMSQSEMASIIKLYAENGLEKMMNGIESCVKHSAPNLAYLEACLKGEPRKKKAQIPAQQYEQRDYSNEQDEAMKRMLALGGA